MNQQKVNYHIENVPTAGQYYVAKTEFDATSLSKYSMNSTSKIVLMGNPAVGKTCLCTKMAFNEFSDNYCATIGAQYIKCDVKVNGSNVTLQIWDVAGQKDYSSISMFYCRQTDIALFCFDLTRKETLDNIISWKENFLSITSTSFAMFLVGCKSDLTAEKKVTDKEIEEFCKANQMEYFSTSSKTSYNTKELVERVAFYAAMNAQSSRAIKSERIQISESAVTLSEPTEKATPSSKKKCCT